VTLGGCSREHQGLLRARVGDCFREGRAVGAGQERGSGIRAHARYSGGELRGRGRGRIRNVGRVRGAGPAVAGSGLSAEVNPRALVAHERSNYGEYRTGWRPAPVLRDDPGIEINLDATQGEPANDTGPTVNHWRFFRVPCAGGHGIVGSSSPRDQ